MYGDTRVWIRFWSGFSTYRSVVSHIFIHGICTYMLGDNTSRDTVHTHARTHARTCAHTHTHKQGYSPQQLHTTHTHNTEHTGGNMAECDIQV